MYKLCRKEKVQINVIFYAFETESSKNISNSFFLSVFAQSVRIYELNNCITNFHDIWIDELRETWSTYISSE